MMVPASTVVLLREQTELELLLMRRHHASGFMAGAYVFPGGKLDPADTEPKLHESVAEGELEALISRLEPTPGSELTRGDALGLMFAALREVFEESGTLLAKRSDGAPVDARTRERWRTRVESEPDGLVTMLTEESLVPSLDELVYFSHWVTPSIEPKRFDTRFFMAALPRGQVASVDDKELTDLRWCSPSKALELHAAGEIFLPPPTEMTIRQILPHESVQDAMHMARSQRVKAILPKILWTEEGIAILLPWDPDYPAAEGEALFEAFERPSSMIPKPTRVLIKPSRIQTKRD